MSSKAHAEAQVEKPTGLQPAHARQRPVAVPEHEVHRPDVGTQLEDAARLGHSLEAIGVESSVPPVVQRRETLDEQKEEVVWMQPDVPRVGLLGGPVPKDLESAINRARGGGQPLEGTIRAQMSERMGHDFSAVRVHTDVEADELSQQLQARAFTTGRHIFFQRGAYDPGSTNGRELLAHELTHVLQQGTNRVGRGRSGMIVHPAGDGFEQEAEAQAQRASTHRPDGNRVVHRLLPQRRPAEIAVQRALNRFEVGAAKYALELTEEGDQPTIAQDTTGVALSERISQWEVYFPGTGRVWEGSLQDLDQIREGTYDAGVTATDYLRDQYGGGAYDAERRLILLDDSATLTDLRHELGHHKQALGGITDQRGVAKVLLEYHNIVKHENEPLALGDRLRVAYTLRDTTYGAYRDTAPGEDDLRNWNTLMQRAEQQENMGRAWLDQERRMMLELDAALKEAKYTLRLQDWQASAGDIIRRNLGVEIEQDRDQWDRLRQ